MPRNLTINPAPFRSSRLAIPPSPFSPKYPVTPPASSPPKGLASTDRSEAKTITELSPPPTNPLRWLWQCHMCGRVYQLGVTRRCLDDGHMFCAGTTTVKRSRKTNKRVMRHKACASEFDYQGWKAWGTWRRSVMEQVEAAHVLAAAQNSGEQDVVMLLNVTSAPQESRWPKSVWTKKPATLKSTKDFGHKNCWNACDYPSECRWGKQYGVRTPVKSTTNVPATPETDNVKTTFDDILLDTSHTNELSADQLEQLTEEMMPLEQTKKVSMDDLLESVKRRKRRSAGQVPSPLASHPPSPTTSNFSTAAEQDVDTASPSTSYLQKALDDFEVDFRKSIGRAGGIMTTWASNIRSTAALEEERAELFVKGLRVTKKKDRVEKP